MCRPTVVGVAGASPSLPDASHGQTYTNNKATTSAFPSDPACIYIYTQYLDTLLRRGDHSAHTARRRIEFTEEFV